MSAVTRVDMHVKILDETVVERAIRRGLDVLVYAPHFTQLPDIRERARRYSTDDLTVIPAREIFTGGLLTRRHLLAVGLSDPIPDFVTLEGALAELDRQGAAVLVPHPGFANVSLDADDVAAHRESVDAVETYNAKLFDYQNGRGRDVAADYDLPVFGSSYAHVPGTVGEAWTEFDGDVDSEASLVEALKTDTDRRVVHRSGLAHRVRSLVEFAHLGFENTWGKLDRLFLSGMEPTHPDHLLYDGRFDDVSVY